MCACASCFLQLRLNVARAKYWLAMGCQPSSAIARLLSRFHLLPLPPQRIPVPTGPLLHRVLAGEDVREEVRKAQGLAEQKADARAQAKRALEAGEAWQAPRLGSTSRRH